MDSLGERRHYPVGLCVGTRTSRGDQDAAQNGRRREYRRGLQTAEEDLGVVAQSICLVLVCIASKLNCGCKEPMSAAHHDVIVSKCVSRMDVEDVTFVF